MKSGRLPLFSSRLAAEAQLCVVPGPHNGWRVRLVLAATKDDHFALFEAFDDARELSRRIRKAGRYDPKLWRLGGTRMEVLPRPMSARAGIVEALMQSRMRRAQGAAGRVASPRAT